MSKMRLPVITAIGGINAAGRSSFHHAYRRMVLESLPNSDASETVVGLATLMGLVTADNGTFRDTQGQSFTADQVASVFREAVIAGTLVRRIEHFDPDAVHWQKNLPMQPDAQGVISFVARRKHLPELVPAGWRVQELSGDEVRVEVPDGFDVKVDAYRQMPVQAGGQLPTGFDPSQCYQSRFHPRGLQMAVVGASDAVNSLGIDWQTVVDSVRPDEIGVYSNSVLSQIDEFSNLGMIQSRMKGGRVSSKHLAMGMSSMPGDFINAYVLGSVGVTGSAVGACATFLYSLRQGVEDIQSGRRRVVLVGSSEAPITPEIIDGFDAMGALATDANLRRLDGRQDVDHRRASRPFGQNCGFVLGEASQYALLMDDELAMELGVDIFGAVPNVFINADGYKKSISAPGPGNYLTLAKAVGSARAILGEKAIRERSVIQAHGSSTPQNRVSESLIFDRVAQAFGIEHWPVGAVKAYLGHSIGPASADQLMATLGVYKYGLLPGIKTMDSVAEDVHADRLGISREDQDLSDRAPQVAFLNSKGFGGNNATASVLAPGVVEQMLEKRYGKQAFSDYQSRREGVREQARAYEEEARSGKLSTIYRFGEGMIDENAIELSDRELRVPGFAKPVDLDLDNPYEDMQ
ncbi:beta-ketoacyl synthase [Gilvimarinus sp. F26214L]|uniref:beta-ketoacyl synthase n=1 Tax=Gilvimarinus sp. DZF01 TaxID=3461371 RepID=UPI004045A211